MGIHLNFGLVCPREIVSAVLWFVEMHLCQDKP